jgi:hypothetical protein
MKKTITLAMLSGLLAGCGNNQQTGTTQTSPAAPSPGTKADYVAQMMDFSNQLSELKPKYFELQSKLTETQTRLTNLLKFAHVPVEVKKRNAAIRNSGFVIQVENLIAKKLPVKVTVQSPTFGTTKDYDLVLDPARIEEPPGEIGWLQGWKAAPGDIVTVSSEGYEPSHFKINDNP